ncbi:unnamed protein product [Somion occarium]|uniref:Probable RNA polymerase II nuclear localization protein SLC7A6OS n=1 Tax=Somion occarium TaxID=3059160 RepID=A0ABP1E0I8_9APHY
METQQRQDTQSESYTIVRIKRKRNEEPLDALVVDQGPRKKRSKAGLNVFRFAETVEVEAWEDERKKKDLEERITALARESSKKKQTIPETSVIPAEPIQPPVRQPQVDPSRSYTVIPSESKDLSKRRIPTSPPKILTSKDYEQQRQPSVTIYEAIPSSTSLASAPSMNIDPEVEKFLPLLQEYLKVSDTVPSFPQEGPSSSQPSKEDDYVWDVFYSHPASYKQLFDSLNVGMVSGLPHSASGYIDSDTDSDMGEEDEDSNAEDSYKNDYPEDESDWDTTSSKHTDDSDIFHERSDHESLFRAEEVNDDYQWP